MISPASDSRQQLLSDISAVNRQVMKSFAEKQFSELASCYSEEAQVLVGRVEPIVGRQSIAAVFAYMRKRIHTLELTTTDVEKDSNTAIEHGRYVHRAETGEILDQGKYLVAWRRTDDRWLIHRDMIVSDMPA